MLRSMILGLAAACVAVPAQAGDTGSASTSKSVERQLQQQLQSDPNDHVALARLARIYLNTDRPAKARRLYRGLLSLDEVMLEAAGTTLSSHALAQSGLRKTAEPQAVRLGSR